jgi:cobalt/nickel transport system permease protein
VHADIFDRYQARPSLIHTLDPRVKLVVSMLFIVSNVLLPDGAWLAFGLSWGLVLAAGRLSGLGSGYTFKRSFVALPFVLAAISAIFSIPGQALVTFDFGPWRLVATEAGLIRFASIVVRSWLSVQAAILLTATTRFPDLMHALRHLRVPQALVSIVAFMYRYLFVLTDEGMRLMRAREARSARPPRGRGGGSLAWRARIAGNMAGQLFLRSYERSDRVYAAMQARGYAGQLLTLHPHEMQARDWASGGLAALVLLGVQLAGRL